MSECIAQRLARDLVDLVTHDRVQSPRCASDIHLQSDRCMATAFGSELLAESRDGLSQVIALDRRGAQSLHGLPSLGNGLRRLINRALKDPLGLGRTCWEVLANRLESEQQSLKALQQCVVQVTRDARALGHTLLEARVETFRDLMQAQLIERP